MPTTRPPASRRAAAALCDRAPVVMLSSKTRIRRPRSPAGSTPGPSSYPRRAAREMVGGLRAAPEHPPVVGGQGGHAGDQGVDGNAHRPGRGRHGGHQVPRGAEPALQSGAVGRHPPPDQSGELGGTGPADLGHGGVLVAAEPPVHPVADPVVHHGHHRDQGHLQLPDEGGAAEAVGEAGVGGGAAHPAHGHVEGGEGHGTTRIHLGTLPVTSDGGGARRIGTRR